MSKRGIDVSSYQQTINWDKVKADGVEFAILKVIRKDLNPDKQFENNWAGCKNAGVAIQGVYNYSYATTVAKAKTDAKRVLEVLNGRKTMVWLDVENDCQEGLGRLLIDIINAYAEVIIGAGLEFGVYTGQYFYNTYIKPHGGINYPKWIARYGKNDGTMNEKYKPTVDNITGWQYTSAGSVKGIVGDVDMDVWYDDIDVSADTPAKEESPEPKTVETLAREVINGIWGNGTKRKANLEAAGYVYAEVQAKVNEILKGNTPVYHKVKKGNTLSGIAKQYETTINAIMEMNTIVNINKIYVGQKIRVK